MTETNSYRALVAMREDLDAKIKAARDEEIATVMEKIQGLVREYQLKPEDIFPRNAKKQTKSVAAKYQDPASGATWTGRGKPPNWTKTVDLEKCRIELQPA